MARDAISGERRAMRVVVVVVAAATLAACSESIVPRAVSYGDSARANYEKGVAELRDENYPEALKYFSHVKNKFPFSRYAPLAELRVADTFFAEEKYVEAIDAYKMFTKFHPTHPQVTDGYAAFRVCQGYVKQIPSDWFLVPPSHEKDQSATRDAVRELQGFMRAFRGSKYLRDVQRLQRKAVRLLADHELYVARFYLDNDKPKATILRLEGVLQRFPEAGVHPEVMLLLGKTYLKLNQHAKAKQTFTALARKYPRDPSGAKAQLYLRYLTQRN